MLTVGIEGAVHGGGQCGYGQGYCVEKPVREAAGNGAGAAQQLKWNVGEISS